MKSCSTYTATIYCGLREGYDGPQHSLHEAADLAQAYVDEVGLCVTVTPTTYVYKDGREDGVAVGLLNYPRFPSQWDQIDAHAVLLAMRLRKAFKQNRVSVVLPGGTVMLEGETVVLRFKNGGHAILWKEDVVERYDGAFGHEMVRVCTLRPGMKVGNNEREIEQVWAEEA